MSNNSIFNAIGSTSNASDRFNSSSNDTSMTERYCDCCGCLIDEESCREIAGNTYCEDCFQSEVFFCDRCGDATLKDDSIFVTGGDRVCRACIDEYYRFCEECEEYVDADEMEWCEDNETYVCTECVDAGRGGYFRCENCGEVHHEGRYGGDRYTIWTSDTDTEEWCFECYENNSQHCEECNRDFSFRVDFTENGCCEYCDDGTQHAQDIAGWTAPYGVRGYSYKPDPCFCFTEDEIAEGHDQTDTVCFGVELEMEDHSRCGRNRSEDADYMNSKLGFTYCKHDGSLTDGIELVSHPASFDYWMSKKDVLEEVFKEMTKRGYTSHDNGHCGLHIHLSLAPFIAADPAAVCALILLTDIHWDKMVRFSRRNEDQLNRWAARYDTSHDRFEDLDKILKADYGRYMAINLQPKHTVEIRMFRGTLKIETFFATLQLVHRMVNICMQTNLDKLRRLTWEEVVGTEFTELNAYCKKRFNPEPVTFEDHTVFEEHPTDAPQEAGEENLFDLFEMFLNEETGWVISAGQMHAVNMQVGDTVEYAGQMTTDGIRPGMRFRVVDTCIEDASGDEENIRCESLDHGLVVWLSSMQLRRIDPRHRVGDWVRITADNSDDMLPYSRSIRLGWYGRIVDPNLYFDLGIEFPHIFPGAHDCNGHGTENCCQYIPARCLELV